MGKPRAICIWIDGKATWFSPEQVRELEDARRAEGPRAPAIHTDAMPPTWHPSADRYYDSKSAFRRETKARGLVEMGNDAVGHRPQRQKPEGIKEDLVETYRRARDGQLPKLDIPTVSEFEKDHGELRVCKTV